MTRVAVVLLLTALTSQAEAKPSLAGASACLPARYPGFRGVRTPILSDLVARAYLDLPHQRSININVRLGGREQVPFADQLGDGKTTHHDPDDSELKGVTVGGEPAVRVFRTAIPGGTSTLYVLVAEKLIVQLAVETPADPDESLRFAQSINWRCLEKIAGR